MLYLLNLLILIKYLSIFILYFSDKLYTPKLSNLILKLINLIILQKYFLKCGLKLGHSAKKAHMFTFDISLKLTRGSETISFILNQD